MSEQITLRVSKELNKKIEVYQIKNDYEDRQDAIRDILENNLTDSFYTRLKKLFRF